MGRAIVILCAIVFLQLGIIYFGIKSYFRQKKELKEVKEKIHDLEVKNNEYNKIHQETIENQKKYRSGDNESNFNTSVDFLRDIKNRKKS